MRVAMGPVGRYIMEGIIHHIIERLAMNQGEEGEVQCSEWFDHMYAGSKAPLRLQSVPKVETSAKELMTVSFGCRDLD